MPGDISFAWTICDLMSSHAFVQAANKAVSAIPMADQAATQVPRLF